MTSQFSSHGRGGAGNMSKANDSPKLTASDLETPTLKTSVVTTGRGGTGNMAKNTDPLETRRRQDVEAIPRRDSYNRQYAGRGGAGNAFRAESEEKQLAADPRGDVAVEDDTASETTDGKPKEEKLEKIPPKSKNWLFGGKKN